MIDNKKDSVIKVRNLFFSYEDNDNLNINDLSFDIKKEEYIAIIGHNGSGKSTLSKLLAGILKPRSGQIFIDDILISYRNLDKIRKKIGIIFQDPNNQFIGTTVYDDIEFGLQNYNVNPKDMPAIIEDAAKKVGILHLMDYEPTNLSGGQKQKVAISSVFALKPEIIIFDESTSMLDPLGTSEVNKLMLELKNKYKKTVISITHDMDEAAKADRVLVLDRGKKVFFDKPENIFLHQHELLKKFGLGLPKSLEITLNLQKLSNTIEDKIMCKNLTSKGITKKLSEQKISVNENINSQNFDKSFKKQITINNINYVYMKGYPSETTALKNLSTKFFENKINVIIGNTGSGKSTLIQHINALIYPQKGNIKINIDNDEFLVTKKRVYCNNRRAKIKKFRQKIGLIFQMPEYQLFNSTVKKEIAFAPINFGTKKHDAYNEVTKWMNLVQLNTVYINQNPFELSGGQKRRVAIAGVLSYDPQIIIFDEPTAGLDPSGTRCIIDIIKNLKKKHKTIILITHNMDHVLELADNIIILRNGMVKHVGSATELLSNTDIILKNSLNKPYVYRILENLNLLDKYKNEVKTIDNLITLFNNKE